MNVTYKEQIFFFQILKTPAFLNSAKPEFFGNKNIQELFKIAKEHAIQFKKIPSEQQLNELISAKGLNEQLTPDMVHALYNIYNNFDEYTDDWLESNTKTWLEVKNLEYVIKQSIVHLKTSNITTENSAEVVEEIKSMFNNGTAIDFDFNLGSDFFDPMSHQQTRLERHSTGYDFIDLCMKGGYWKGSLIAFMGGPKSGKSLWLNNLAARSVYLGFNTAYITLELQEEIVTMRIGSNLLDINLDKYEDAVKDQDFIKKKLIQFKQKGIKQPGYLYIKEFPSSTASSTDIREHLKKAQELLGIKFDNIFVDYINIMRNWRNPNSENTYMKIKQISEDLRAMAMQEQWAVVTVTQTRRDGINGTDLNLNDVSESSALIHTVDMLFGIITNPEMKARNEYYLKCLANRVNGMENVRKKFNVDWKFARIEEDKNSQIEDMDYLLSSVVNNNHQRRQQPENQGNRFQEQTNNEDIVVGTDLKPNDLFE